MLVDSDFQILEEVCQKTCTMFSSSDNEERRKSRMYSVKKGTDRRRDAGRPSRRHRPTEKLRQGGIMDGERYEPSSKS